MAGAPRARRLALAATAMVLILMAVGAVAAAGATNATARIVDASGEPVGWAALVEDGTGRLHLNVHVDGLAAGRHGVHLHAVGSCVGPTFSSAGGHFDPFGHEHGLANPNGAHAGDLPNLVVNVAGRGHLDATTDLATLSDGAGSLFDADGSALIVHANQDDQVTNPSGNSGARIACGVIEAG